MAIFSTPKKAWATLITKPSYIAGVLTLYRTLQAISTYPLVAMVTDTLPESCRALMRAVGIVIVEIPHLSPSASQHSGKFDPKFSRFSDTWTKLGVFGLVDYERIIMIDADMIFLRPMDELFEMELPGPGWIAATPACVCNALEIASYPDDWIPDNCSYNLQSHPTTIDSPPLPTRDGKRTSHLLNSGLVILEPSADLFTTLVHHLNTSPTIASMKFPDQDFLAEVFMGKWKPLPWWCNALKTGRAVHPDLWQDSEIRLIHYILDKPWTTRTTLSLPAERTIARTSASKYSRDPVPRLSQAVRHTPEQESVSDYDGLHAWWWIAYDAMIEEMKAEGRDWKYVEATLTL
ncbi:hypothetical protein P7C73_g4837, partial [Tremellales sp. Uapishka_1]